MFGRPRRRGASICLGAAETRWRTTLCTAFMALSSGQQQICKLRSRSVFSECQNVHVFSCNYIFEQWNCARDVVKHRKNVQQHRHEGLNSCNPVELSILFSFFRLELCHIKKHIYIMHLHMLMAK